MFQDFSSLIHEKTFCISNRTFHFYSFIFTCLQSFMPFYLKKNQTKNDVICLQPSNKTYITPTLQYYLYLTHMSRLWPRKGACVFYSMMVAYNFDFEVRCCEFCKCCDLLWVLGCLRFWFAKVINVFCFRIKEKKIF